MINIRRADERGFADHGWLQTHHTFSFADYRDENHNRFRSLRVMNEDYVVPGKGFGTHPHRDMEIVTYVLSGQLEHRDSMGNGEIINAGEFQRMTAGSGITHSEFNPSDTDPVHLYQIWLFPNNKGLTPSYEQKKFPGSERVNQLQKVASPDGAEHSLLINQDANIYLAKLTEAGEIAYQPEASRATWIQVLSGLIEVNGESLRAGDGISALDETSIRLAGRQAESEVMLFDLA